jgi:hypothetical protein
MLSLEGIGARDFLIPFLTHSDEAASAGFVVIQFLLEYDDFNL